VSGVVCGAGLVVVGGFDNMSYVVGIMQGTLLDEGRLLMANLPSKAPSCSRCGSRLFLDSEVRGRRLIYLWDCAIGCSRQFYLDGRLVARQPRAVRELVTADAG